MVRVSGEPHPADDPWPASRGTTKRSNSTATGIPARQLYRLGDVMFEVETERAPPGERRHFPLQVGGKRRVLCLHLPKQVAHNLDTSRSFSCDPRMGLVGLSHV